MNSLPSDPSVAYLTPEAKARVEIDRMLAAAGWVVQDYARVNLSAARGVAVREFVLKSPHGRADYLLFVDGEAVGVAEAKKQGETLTGVAWQTAKYVDGLPDELLTAVEGALPFAYQSTGVETRFTNTLDPDAKSRQVFWYHRPETLAGWINEIRAHPLEPTLRHRMRGLPALESKGLWPAQERAIRSLEQSLAADRPRALIQMATGAGKTFTAANIAYRLVKFADARRILFLVDRANLGRQTLTSYRWLDLSALCARLLPKDRINRIRYFSATVSARPDNPDAPQRQQVYLRALETIPGLSIHYGHYLRPRYADAARQPNAARPRTVEVVKTEEKGSDVNLATYLLLDGFKRDCTVAVVISNDSDLKLPIEIAQSELGIRVGVVNPHPPARRSRALQPTFFKQLRTSALGACQFPAVLMDTKGEIRKPASW